jgi:hypothetical protein
MSCTDLKQLWKTSTHLVELASRGAPLPAILDEVARVAREVTGACSSSAVYLRSAGQDAPAPIPGGTCWSFPILSNNSVLGTLEVRHQAARPLSRAEIAAMRYLVTIASAAIERDRYPTAAAQPRIVTRRPDLPAAGCRTGEGMDSIRRFIAGEQQDGDPASR